MRMDKKHFIAVTGEIRNHLGFLAETGCQGFDCSEKSLDILRNWGKDASQVQNRQQTSSPDMLEIIRRLISNCRRCKLSAGRMNIVFGAGNPGARLVFVGDAPGYEEDQSGEPFVGEAGQLLTKIIENGMKLTRNQVYVCNIVKCRPPGNRPPGPDEISACLPFLKRQIAAIKPAFICALGESAAQAILITREPISRLRGRFHNYEGIKVMPTFHPAHLVRHPEKKRETWEDIQKLMKELKNI